MAQTAHRLSLNEAATKLRLTGMQVLDLVLANHLQGERDEYGWEVSAASVEEFLADPCPPLSVDIPVRQGRLDDEGEDDYFKERQT